MKTLRAVCYDSKLPGPHVITHAVHYRQLYNGTGEPRPCTGCYRGDAAVSAPEHAAWLAQNPAASQHS